MVEMTKKVAPLTNFLPAVCFSLVLATPAVADEKQIAYGEYLSGECVTCHQINGKVDGIPAIIGWDQEIFVSVFDEYRNKIRPNEAMQTIATRLSDEEVAALAAYFETIKPKP
jgi:cytochrome c